MAMDHCGPTINYEKDRSANLGIFSTVYHLTTPPALIIE
jgi:hypothetical protein